MIRFISYDGAFPCLCSGTLVVELDGTRYEVGPHALHTGGSVSFDENWSETVTTGEWTLMISRLPDELKPHIRELEDLVNEHVPLGCCGGCV